MLPLCLHGFSYYSTILDTLIMLQSLARQLRSAFVGVRQSETDNLLALLRDRYTVRYVA